PLLPAAWPSRPWDWWLSPLGVSRIGLAARSSSGQAPPWAIPPCWLWSEMSPAPPSGAARRVSTEFGGAPATPPPPRTVRWSPPRARQYGYTIRNREAMRGFRPEPPCHRCLVPPPHSVS